MDRSICRIDGLQPIAARLGQRVREVLKAGLECVIGAARVFRAAALNATAPREAANKNAAATREAAETNAAAIRAAANKRCVSAPVLGRLETICD